MEEERHIAPNTKTKTHSPTFPPPPHPDNEIGIFSAERYFKELYDDDSRHPHSIPTPSVPLSEKERERERQGQRQDLSLPFIYNHPIPTTPTASSDASWNSQRGLLSHSHPHPHPPRKAAASRRVVLCPTCPCSGRRSVQVEEKLSELNNNPRTVATASASVGRKKSMNEQDLAFGLTTLKIVTEDRHNNNSQLYAPKTQRILSTAFNEKGTFTFPLLIKSAAPDDPPRFSLEVFNPKGEATLSLPSEEMRRSFTFSGRIDDDMASDASSDLFEIESFSTNVTSATACRRRDPLEQLSGFLGTDPARPSSSSEASVQWSVTTAEGFDRRSVGDERTRVVSAVEQSKERRAGRGLLLLSCKSTKAVNVVPNATKQVALEEQPGLTRSLSARAARLNRLRAV